VTDVEYTDSDLQQGLNIYQALVYLEDGTVISSSQETVYYLNNRLHIIYPNPSPRGTDITVLSEQPGDETALLYDNFGRLLMRIIIAEKNQRIPTGSLPPGMYHMRILSLEGSPLRYSFIIR
jgi:hypothetical protein